MSLREYFPSAQFTLIAVSIVLSAGLVLAAQTITHPPVPRVAIVSDSTPLDSSGWEASLYAIEAQNASTSIMAPAPNTVDELLTAAQTPNVTDMVGRNLVINLSNAKSQGLGDDVPTQDQIIAQAAAVVNNQQNITTYGLNNLTVVDRTPSTMHTYGNNFIATLNKYPAASEQTTLIAVGNAVQGVDLTQLKNLPVTAAAYKQIVADLLQLPVPKTLAPLHLQIINDYSRIVASYTDMEVIVSDPLRGLAGMQNYESALDEEGRLFTNIAQDLSKDGILFTKDEPGSAWSAFTSPSS